LFAQHCRRPRSGVFRQGSGDHQQRLAVLKEADFVRLQLGQHGAGDLIDIAVREMASDGSCERHVDHRSPLNRDCRRHLDPHGCCEPALPSTATISTLVQKMKANQFANGGPLSRSAGFMKNAHQQRDDRHHNDGRVEWSHHDGGRHRDHGRNLDQISNGAKDAVSRHQADYDESRRDADAEDESVDRGAPPSRPLRVRAAPPCILTA
jgi:hypothetical protein